jgi:hypothetical protein
MAVTGAQQSRTRPRRHRLREREIARVWLDAALPASGGAVAGSATVAIHEFFSGCEDPYPLSWVKVFATGKISMPA